MNKFYFQVFLLLAAAAAFAGCDGDGGKGSPCDSDFGQEALFQNVADKLVIPGYAEFGSRVEALKAAAETFFQSPSTTTLDGLRSQFEMAYMQWQRVAQYEFGPAEEQMLRARFNNFPLNVAALEARLAAGDYSLDNPDAFDKGFPALDYLLYGLADSGEAIAARLADPQQEAYRNYLMAILDDMAGRAGAVLEAWQQGGYREAFIANTGLAAGTALSLLINNLNEHYEFIKRDKVGLPAGVLTLGFTNPDKVEAYYSGLSLALAMEATLAAEQLYLGRSISGADGPGLDDYLNAVGATREGQSLDVAIRAQFAAAISALEQISGPLSAAVQDDNEAVVAAYNALTRQVVNIKTDMPSVLCVAITYVDNPSDSD